MPSKAEVDLQLDDIRAELDGDLDLELDLGLDNIKAEAKVDAGLDDIRAEAKVDAGLDDIRAQIEASVRELAPLLFNFLWKEIPIVRVGFPHRYQLRFSLFGHEVFGVDMCGESEVVSERNE